MWYESTLLARSFSVSALVLLGLIGAGLFGTYRDRRTARDAPSEREAAEQKEGQGGEES